MNIFSHYVKLASETAQLLTDVNAILVESDGTDSHYVIFLQDRWDEGKTFIIIEQDIVCTIEQLEELQNCSEPICAYAYTNDIDYNNPKEMLAFGCIKIDASVIESLPKLWEEMEPKLYYTASCWFTQNVRDAGFSIHQHSSTVTNLSSIPIESTPEEIAKEQAKVDLKVKLGLNEDEISLLKEILSE